MSDPLVLVLGAAGGVGAAGAAVPPCAWAMDWAIMPGIMAPKPAPRPSPMPAPAAPPSPPPAWAASCMACAALNCM